MQQEKLGVLIALAILLLVTLIGIVTFLFTGYPANDWQTDWQGLTILLVGGVMLTLVITR